MPNYNIYYFVIKPLQINVATGRSGVTLASPGPSSPVVQSIFAAFRTDLIGLMNQARQRIPHIQSRAQTINVIQIPALAGNPTSPNFSGLSIQMHEPIVYFTTRELNERPSAPVDRRPEYIMLDAIRNARTQEFPDSWVRDARASLSSLGDHSGLGSPGLPDISCPAIASVYSNGRQNWEATNWQELLAFNLASAAFHEIAHCKLETRSRSNNPRWRKAINDPSRPAASRYASIHDIPNVSVLASNGVGRTPTTADYTQMGEHMLCPINFYRLDQNINNQCFRNGSAVTLTPRT
ncbi:MAG: hypothetical protein A2V93_00755 [Ignavibacteria bacterium RBG_16_34_14]|nr:MAG: hypothetical protein A2V93_00755 [Ignavibacteria bacterium RBG_16_34_14]